MARTKGTKKSKGKNEAKQTPECERHGQIKAEPKDKKESLKAPEAAPDGQDVAEAIEVHYDIYRFICNWFYVFMWVFLMAFVAIVFSGHQLLSNNYDETLWIIVLAIFCLYFIATGSSLLALKVLPGLLEFIVKFVGIFSFFIVGTTTVFILTRSNLLGIDFNETLVNIVYSMCIIWWISIISLVAALVIIYNATKLKRELICFMTFIIIYGFIFCLLLIMLMILGISSGYNLLGFNLGEIFFKIAASLCIMHFLASISMCYVNYTSRQDWNLFQLAA